MLMTKNLFIFLNFANYVLAKEQKRDCNWDVHNCNHAEVLCNSEEEESVYLDAKDPNAEESDHCYAILDEDKGEFKNYEISVEMLSLESTEGTNSGNVGIMFNFLDEMNYDFVYLE